MTSVLNGQMDAAFVFEGARNVFGRAFPNNNLFKDLKVFSSCYFFSNSV